MDEMEPTIDQKKEWTVEALSILGFAEQDQFPGMYSRDLGNIRSVVDLTAGRTTYLYNISQKRRIEGDESDLLATLDRMLDEAETGAMPAKTEPDYIVNTSAVPIKETTRSPAITALATLPVGYKPDLSIDVIKKYINNKATNEEAYVFLELCKARDLNPFIGDAYLIKYDHVSAATMIVGKGALLKRAQAHPEYDGFEAGIIVLNDEDVLERRPGSFLLESETLLGGWAKVYRKDTEHPVVSEVTLEEYIGRKKTGEVNKMWSTKAATMIRKVPLMQGLRESFAEELNGMFDRSEMNMGEAEVV